MHWHAPQSGKRGRNRSYSDAAIQCCLSFKALFNLALRQTLGLDWTGLVESLIKPCALPWMTPNFSTLCRRQKDLDMNVQYTPSSGALHLLIDATGMKFLVEGECKTKKHGAERRRQWRKVHTGMDERDLQIQAIVVTTSDVGDSPVVPKMLQQIPADEPIASLRGDGAYGTKTIYECCHERHIMPIIPPCKRAQIRKGAACAPRNDAIAACRRFGRTIWKDWSGYHRRSLVEAKMSCFKKTW